MRIDTKEDIYEIACWNRNYTYQNSLFPTSIKIGGQEILHAPISLNAMFGEKEGVWRKGKKILLEENEGVITFSVAMEAENLIVNGSVQAEEDGFIRTDFSLIPFWCFDEDNQPRLTKLWIDIPIKKEFASLMHFWPNCESGVCLSHTVLNSGSVPEEGMKLPFKPYTWLGWEDGGFGICCEDDRSFLNTDKDSVYVIENKEDHMNLRIALLDEMPYDWRERRDEWGNNIHAITFTVGLQATPVKMFPAEHLTNWRAFHLYDVSLHPIFEPVRGDGTTLLERIASKGTKWLILHEDWSVIQNYGFPADEKQFIRFADDCHRLGMKLMVYFGYEVSSLLPQFHTRKDLILNKNVEGNTVGGWQREPVQRDYTVCYKGDYSDTMIERVKYVMDVLKVDGIYTDGTYVPWECANENHGCGYRDKDGTLHYTYPIFAVREHVKKLYRAVHEREGIIDTHQSSCCLMATLAYVDSYFDGENIQGMLKEDISKLRLDTFRAEFTGNNMGIPCNFISYTDERYTLRMIAGITLLHNVYPRANRIEDIGFISNIWKLFDEFGVQEAEWYPYWQKQQIGTGNPKVYLSYYKKGKEYLLLITSFDPDVKSIRIELDCQAAKDLLDGTNLCVCGNGYVEIPVEYANLMIIKVRSAK